MSYALALVQARMGSTRLPGKCMADLCGVPLLAHVLRRTRAAELVKHTVLAIPDTPENDVLADLGKAEGVDVYRGSETDVLGRLFWASQLYPADVPIVRITADDPCKDPALIDQTITGFLLEWGRKRGRDEPEEPVPYMWLGDWSWPLGLDVEVFSPKVLREAYGAAHDPEDREHVTPWMKRLCQRGEWGLWTLKDKPMRCSMNTRLTVDTPEDLAFVRGIYEALYPQSPMFSYPEILAHLKAA